MRILEILWNIVQLLSKNSTYNSTELSKTIAGLKQYNSLLITLDENLYNEVQSYIATLDAEYAYSIDSSSSINSAEVARITNELKSFIEKSANKIPLDLTIFNKTGSYTIEDSEEYFDKEKLSDSIIIQEGTNNFYLKGFELIKYLNFIKTKRLLSRIQKHMTTINDDAIPFGWLYADSQKFQLSDLDFLEYLRLFIEVLFKNNGKIVYGGKGTAYDWIETKDFGESPTDISINLLKAFKTHKEQSTENSEYIFTYNVWFAKSDKDHPMYLRQLDI